MSPFAHRIYIATLVSIVVLTTIFLFYKGIPYYSTPLEERFYHPDHDWFKPSGAFGHGLGIVGTLLILIGVFGYIARKRYRFLSKFGRLKYWLEFHIFLCSLGPVMILFHTAFKFGGIVSVSFWSMVAVVASGVIGRFIYIQIPRTIEGRELSLEELQEMKGDVDKILRNAYNLGDMDYKTLIESTRPKKKRQAKTIAGQIISKYFEDRRTVRNVKKMLLKNNMTRENVRKVAKLINKELSLGNRIERLQTMRTLFKYWHVAHLPFAIIMLIIMIIHVAVTLAFGYRWIF
ncbi:MAG TPA: hypothetical protein ENJ20_05605 [Bacteroidetes bacterium]|nr:hypothetical protein [Bacteroidota bacterium]